MTIEPDDVVVSWAEQLAGRSLDGDGTVLIDQLFPDEVARLRFWAALEDDLGIELHDSLIDALDTLDDVSYFCSVKADQQARPSDEA